MTNKTIFKAIYRLEVCAWAYGWSEDRLKNEIKNFIIDKQFEEYFERERENERCLNNLRMEIRNNTFYEEPILLKEIPNNRSYGNKYIKRKYR